MKFICKVPVGTTWLTLDLRNKHEQSYFSYSVTGQRHPQAEIDDLLLQKYMTAGARLLDLGANIGFTALRALEIGYDKVVCVEAVPPLYERLKEVASDSLTAHNFAAGNENKMVDFYISKTHNQGSTYDIDTVNRFRHIFGDDLSTVQVQMVTLDDFTTDSFDVWKIDVEGAELDVLQGASKSLEARAPKVILVEIFDTTVLKKAADLLRPYFKNAYRALVIKDRAEVVLLPMDMETMQVEVGDVSKFANTSPMFVFTND